MSEEFVTLKEAQALLGVSNFTVWRMVKDGRLKAYPSQVDRRKKLVHRADIDALLRPNLDAKKAIPLAV